MYNPLDELRNVREYLILINFIDDTNTKVKIEKDKNKENIYRMILKRDHRQISFSCIDSKIPDILKIFKQFLILFHVSYIQFSEAFDIYDKNIYKEYYKNYMKLSKLYSDDELECLSKL